MASSIRTTEFAVLAACVLFAGVASADAVTDQARAAALAGKKAYDTNDFVTAIARYEEAYRLKPAAGLLFNLGQSHRRAGHPDQALSYFRRYLETDPPRAQAEAVEALVAQVQQEAEAKKKADEEAKARAAREDEERRQREAAQRALEVENAKLAASTAEAEAATRRLELEKALKAQEAAKAPPPVYQRWWFWTGIGVVVAGAVATSVAVATAPKPAATTFPDINAR